MRTILVVAAASALLSVAGCKSEQVAGTVSTAPDPLARPLALPKLAGGAPCPRAEGRAVNPAFGPAVGAGPVYAVLGARAELDFIYPAVEGQEWYPSDWSGQKVLWVIDARYGGKVLIRGGRIDAAGRLGFGGASKPEWEMRIAGNAPDNTSGGWSNFPSYTRLKDSGCYAYQVDGRNFSYTIVFSARRQSL